MKSYQCVTGSESLQRSPERPPCETEKFTFVAMEILACRKCQDVVCLLRKAGGMEEGRLTEKVCVRQAAELSYRPWRAQVTPRHTPDLVFATQL